MGFSEIHGEGGATAYQNPSYDNRQDARTVFNALASSTEFEALNSGALHLFSRELFAYFLKYGYLPLAVDRQEELFGAASQNLASAPWIGRAKLDGIEACLVGLVDLGILAFKQREPQPAPVSQEPSARESWEIAWVAELLSRKTVTVAGMPQAGPMEIVVRHVGEAIKRARELDEKRRSLLQVESSVAATPLDKLTQLKLDQLLRDSENQNKKIVVKYAAYHGRTWFGATITSQNLHQLIDRVAKAYGSAQVEFRLLLVSPHATPRIREYAPSDFIERAGHEGLPMVAKDPRLFNIVDGRYFGERGNEGFLRGVIITAGDEIRFVRLLNWRMEHERGIYGASIAVSPESSLALLANRHFDEVFKKAWPIADRRTMAGRLALQYGILLAGILGIAAALLMETTAHRVNEDNSHLLLLLGRSLEVLGIFLVSFGLHVTPIWQHLRGGLNRLLERSSLDDDLDAEPSGD